MRKLKYRKLHNGEYTKFEAADLELSTMLFDKNGQEVFEGDVVLRDDGEVGEIKWYGSGLTYISITDDTYSRGFTFIPFQEIRVIGNIHQKEFQSPQKRRKI